MFLTQERWTLLGSAASCILVLASAVPANATNFTWSGSGTGGNTATDPANPATQWSQAGNWVGGVPTGSSNYAYITFSNAGAVYATTWSIGYLYVDGTSPDAKLVLNTGARTINYLVVGANGIGHLTQNDGVLNGNTTVGESLGSTGTYDLYDGAVTCSGLNVGWNGNGTFNQFGGTVTCSTSFYLGYYASGVGTYNLMGGRLTIPNMYSAGTAVINQSGGEFVSTGSITLTYGKSYELHGGILNASLLTVGTGGKLSQSGGSVVGPTTLSAGGTIEGTFATTGTFTYNGGTFNAGFVNHGTAVLAASFQPSDGVENYGTITLNAGVSASLDGAGLYNSGAFTLNGGSLGGASLTNDYSGQINASGTITSDLANKGTLATTGLLKIDCNTENLGAISVDALRTIDTTGTISNTGRLTLSGGLITGAGSIANNPGGTIQGGGGLSVPVANNGGLIRASQQTALVISSLVGGNANGGELAVADSATLRIDAGFANYSIVTLEGPAAVLTGGTIDNQNTITGQGRITSAIANQGVVRADGGTLTLSAAGVVNPSGGTFEIEPGSRLLVTQGLASNEGDILIRGGTMESAAGATTNTGLVAGYGTVKTHGLTNTGSVMAGSGNLDVFGSVVNNGVFSVEAGHAATFYGDVSGSGTFPGPGNYVFLGKLSPGNSPGVMDFAGNVTLVGTARLFVELADDDNSDPLCPHYDCLSVAGNVSLGGKLELDWVELAGEAGRFGGVYNLVVYKGSRTGQFSSIISGLAAYLDGPLRYDVDLGGGWKAVQITLHDLLDGDANLDGMVDRGDLGALSAGMGADGQGWSAGDFNRDGQIDATDYILLKRNMGLSLPIAGGGLAAESLSAVVPEPASATLLALGALAVIRRRRRAAT